MGLRKPGAEGDKTKDKKPKENGGDLPGDDTATEDDTSQEDDDSESDDEETEVDDSKLDDAAKKYISKLRKENAKYRNGKKQSDTALTKLQEDLASMKKGLKGALGLKDDDDVDPAQEAQALKGTNAALVLNNAVAESAIEHGIPKEQYKYFRFLVSEKLESLKDGEELADEDMAAIATEVKKLSGTRKTTTGAGAGGNGGNPPASGGGTEITAEAFKKMTTIEKTVLYEKNPTLYEQLKAAAK